MRIYSLTTWVIFVFLSSIVASQEQPTFIFDGGSFLGQKFAPAYQQSSVFNYSQIEGGKDFRWQLNGTEGDVTKVVEVDLMNGNNEVLAQWCSDTTTCPSSPGFTATPSDDEHGTINLGPEMAQKLQGHLGEMLYFRLDWQPSDGRGKQSSWSQTWAVASDDTEAGVVFSSYSSLMTAGGSVYHSPGPASTTTPVATSATSASAASGLATSAAASQKTGRKQNGLTTGAIVGIVVGCVGGLILVSVVAGCFCFRRRRNIDADGGGSRGVQDIIAEKEAHASILDRDQPDTPYSEQNSQNPLNRGVGMPGRNESGIDLSIGQAISGEGCGSIRSESVYTGNGGHDRNSAVYSSLGGAANSVHGTPVIGSAALASGNSNSPTQNLPSSVSIQDRSSAMGSPVPRSSLQQDRSFSPYTDRAAQHDYSQHHHVVDGADLVQQEHSNDSTARSPSSLYSNPLEELQPISPESARENDGAAAAAAVAAGASQPRGHARSTTPSGISGQYAHLVEEGMTDDEIRRLEEEERVLDEAIEQAGTGGRKR
ncbi:hypothetical protein J7T55_008431 [Diaporthe amygdali]|uniref:uncharacterized protein n=1 Tax=Phomopsis amygdali TaxID=1214568 RepID=UPI0022FEEC40|nr:uncharacterized protein J7T55_008431 [Diaporthe amygdali]KAJ0121268.1 hypothetical protein J7T55_008431 [Diaporthe amygdali]